MSFQVYAAVRDDRMVETVDVHALPPLQFMLSLHVGHD